MTQKELLYVEDAVNHELNIIAYLNDALSCINDEKLSCFLDDEVKCHNNIYKKLTDLLEGESNE